MIMMSLFLMTAGSQCNAQKKFKHILKSSSIPEIEEFLKMAHPEDPRRSVLKPRLVMLRNQSWTLGARHAKPMAARPVEQKSGKISLNDAEKEEFQKIMKAFPHDKEKTVKLLNYLFNVDIGSKEAILLCKNNSDCDIIMRIKGQTSYNLAVPAHGENFVILQKGEYILNSDICGLPYHSKKEVEKGVSITLGSPT